MEKQAIEITKRITPKFALGYMDVYHITLSYLYECKRLNVKYDEKELARRITSHTVYGL